MTLVAYRFVLKRSFAPLIKLVPYYWVRSKDSSSEYFSRPTLFQCKNVMVNLKSLNYELYLNFNTLEMVYSTDIKLPLHRNSRNALEPIHMERNMGRFGTWYNGSFRQ